MGKILGKFEMGTNQMLEREKKGIKVVLTGHAMERISERFGVQNPARIADVFGRALRHGFVSADGKGALIEYGCLLIAAERCDGVLVIKTVLNISRGISEKLRGELSHEKPSPWNDCKVVLPGVGTVMPNERGKKPLQRRARVHRATEGERMVNQNELKVVKRYEAEGWRTVRGGAPDFLFLRVRDGEIEDAEFVEVKREGGGLTYEQSIYRRVLEKLGAKFRVEVVGRCPQNQSTHSAPAGPSQPYPPGPVRTCPHPSQPQGGEVA